MSDRYKHKITEPNGRVVETDSDQFAAEYIAYSDMVNNINNQPKSLPSGSGSGSIYRVARDEAIKKLVDSYFS